MKVTFRANANVLGYKAGNIYTEELTPLLKAVLLNDTHLVLIDPPTLEVRRPEKEIESKKSGKKPVENIDKENTDHGNPQSTEREESIQDSGSTGTA